MPKLLQINVCNNVFSTGKIVSEIGELAINNGWSSYVAYGRGTKPDKNRQIKVGWSFGHVLHGLETRLFDNHAIGISSYIATNRLIRTIEKIRPDVIHLHVLSGYYINIRVLFKYLSKVDIPIVWTLHSCWEFTGHCTHYDYIKCQKWKTGCERCPLTKEYPESWFIDRSAKNYKGKKRIFNSLKNVILVPVSRWLSSQVEQSFLNRYPIQQIYNGVDINFFRPLTNIEQIRQELNVSDKCMLIALASSWTPKKGIADYFELARKLDPQKYVLFMVGIENSKHGDIPEVIRALPVTKNRNQLLKLYNAADIVLNLSYEESFGLTTVEGLACGTPSIVYNCTASPELVSPETGFVVEPRNIHGLIDCISKIEENGKSYYSEACRKRAEEHFNKDKCFEKYIELYDSLINKE